MASLTWERTVANKKPLAAMVMTRQAGEEPAAPRTEVEPRPEGPARPQVVA